MGTQVILGHNIENGQQILVEQFSRARSTYIIGKTGMGKSVLLEQIAYQDIVNGDGLIVIDPHEDLANELLAVVPRQRQQDVIFWDTADRERPFSLNPFNCPAPDFTDKTVGNFLAALESLKDFALAFENAPHMRDVLRHLAIAFVVNQGRTLIETPAFLTDEAVRETFYPGLAHEYPWVLTYWEDFDRRKPFEQRTFVASSLNKLRPFATDKQMRNIFGGPRNAIDFRRAMDTGKIIIVKLSTEQLGPDSAGFVGAMIIWQVLEAARSRATILPEERRPFHIIADEFQTYMSTAFPILQEQARKYGVDTTVAHQIREQLDDGLRARVSGVGTLIVFQVTHANAEALAGEFKIEAPEPPIQRLEPTYEVVSTPLKHLSVHPHEDPAVMELYRHTLEQEHWFFEDIYSSVKILEDIWRQWLRPLYPPSDTFEHWFPALIGVNSRGFDVDLETRKDEFVEGLDTFLYHAMRSAQHPDEKNFTAFDWASPRRISVTFRAIQTVEKLTTDLYQDVLNSFFREKLYKDVSRISSLEIAFAERCYVNFALLGIADDLNKIQDDHDAYRALIWKKVVAVGGLQTGKPEKDQYIQSVNENAALLLQQFDSAKKQVIARGDLGSHVVLLGEALADLAYHLYKTPILTTTGQFVPIPDKPRLLADVKEELAGVLTHLPPYHARCKLVTEQGVEDFEIVTQRLTVTADPSLAAEIKRRSQMRYGRPPQKLQPSARLEDDAHVTSDDHDTIEFGEKKTAAQSVPSAGE